MAPADRNGYRLLPSDDLSAAGGPITPAKPAKRRIRETPEAPSRPQPHRRHAKYDGALRYDLSADPLVIHPHTLAVQAWNVWISMILLVDVVYLPVETAFDRSLPRASVFWFNLFCTACFAADIVLQFFLQVRSPTGEYWIFSHSKIIRTYLTSFFLVDLISVLPFNYLIRQTSSADKHGSSRVYIEHLLQFLRLLRLLRFRHVLLKYRYDVDVSHLKRSMLRAYAAILLSLHLMSCAWSTLGNYQVGQDWLKELMYRKTLHGGHDFYDSLESDAEDAAVTYITSFYFALYTLTGIGYGDIIPSTVPEYLYLIVMMLCGSLIWATVIGEMVSVMQHAGMDEIHHQEKLDTVLYMSREYSFTGELHHRVQKYFQQLPAIRRTAFVQRIVARMNSELAVQFVHVIHGPWLCNVWWLRQVSRTTFIVQLTVQFCPTLFCPKESIMTDDRLYVIQRGLCVHGRQILSRNSCWGVDMLLSQGHLRQNRMTMAISYLHVLYLTRELLHQTLARFPRERQLVRHAYRTLCVMRGIIWRAKQLQAKERASSQQQGQERGHSDFVGMLGETCPIPEQGSEVSVLPGASPRVPAAWPNVNESNAESQRLEKLEELAARMERVEGQVAEAVELITAALRKREHRGPMESPQSGDQTVLQRYTNRMAWIPGVQPTQRSSSRK